LSYSIDIAPGATDEQTQQVATILAILKSGRERIESISRLREYPSSPESPVAAGKKEYNSSMEQLADDYPDSDG
jgi:hypothetical protein